MKKNILALRLSTIAALMVCGSITTPAQASFRIAAGAADYFGGAAGLGFGGVALYEIQMFNVGGEFFVFSSGARMTRTLFLRMCF